MIDWKPCRVCGKPAGADIGYVHQTCLDERKHGRQEDIAEMRRSQELLDGMPDSKLFAAGVEPIPADVHAGRMLLRMAIWDGQIDIYNPVSLPEWTPDERVYNVWDYDRWERLKVHEWLVLELKGATRG